MICPCIIQIAVPVAVKVIRIIKICKIPEHRAFRHMMPENNTVEIVEILAVSIVQKYASGQSISAGRIIIDLGTVRFSLNERIVDLRTVYR